MIGSLGDVVFEVSIDKVKTFDGLQLQRSASYTEHSIHGRKGLLEFTGFSAATASLNIKLDANLKVNPKEELETLRKMFTEHKAIPFILNGEPQGDNLWVIESISEDYKIIDNLGIAITIDVSIKLKEYIELEDEA